MVISTSLVKGLKLSRKYVVKPEHSARYVGSGSVDVLSTPSLIAFMEETCRLLIEDKLPENYISVGTMVNIRHTAAVPIGDEVEVKAELLSVDGRRLTFWVEAWWKGKKIGHGVHERVIVNRDEFLSSMKK